MTKIIRTATNGCFLSKFQRGFGTYFVPCPDPEGKDINLTDAFLIHKEFPKIPACLTTAIRLLYLAMLKGELIKNARHGAYEVSVLLIRRGNEWRVLVPKQVVTRADVRADTTQTIDLISGEKFECFPPLGWSHAGSSHSHNTMGAFFSGGDDASELTCPGLHFVIGRLKSVTEFDIAVSITSPDHQRRLIKPESIAEWESDPEVAIASEVYDYITIASPGINKRAVVSTSHLELEQLKTKLFGGYREAKSKTRTNKYDAYNQQDNEPHPLALHIQSLLNELYAEDQNAAAQLVEITLPAMLAELDEEQGFPQDECEDDETLDPFYYSKRF